MIGTTPSMEQLADKFVVSTDMGVWELYSHEDWSRVFQTHVFGPLGVTRAFLPHFREKKSGTLVFIGSTAAWGGIPTLGAYCASKSALRGKSSPTLHPRQSGDILTAARRCRNT